MKEMIRRGDVYRTQMVNEEKKFSLNRQRKKREQTN